jgi:hypothetical protein
VFLRYEYLLNQKLSNKEMCWSPNWNEHHTASGTPPFGILANPYPNQFGESPFQYGDCYFGVFFSRAHDRPFLTKIPSQRHGAPLLTKNLGNQHTAPANQELGEQEKGRLLLTSQIEGVVSRATVTTTTTTKTTTRRGGVRRGRSWRTPPRRQSHPGEEGMGGGGARQRPRRQRQRS